ncbi:hypothetical protein [Halopseudomonas salina]|uniref:Uncharacterized protein n=1 Tax=Halopseudomonas salina TaxID=1323744 RepID=A0ABQ1P1V9_9GAMM|nr:hypothetical protein [Halopseudomonas salina]GGC87416.1 hypothetical protein GCM10007418_03960 [Halopseudomonas salina]
MECPKCRYEPTMAEQAESPGICPKCGVVYAKVQAQRNGKGGVTQGPSIASQMAATARPSPPRAVSNDNELVAIDGEVVVTGVQIPFFSLIWLMTKIILAALPAMMLAAFIVFLLVTFFGSAISSFNQYSGASATPPSAISAEALRSRAAATARSGGAESCEIMQELGGAIMTGHQGGMPMANAISAVKGNGEHSDEILSTLVTSAYKRPRHPTSLERQEQIDTFKRETYDWCVENSFY